MAADEIVWMSTQEAARRLDRARIHAADLRVRRPTLDEVVLALAGHGTAPAAPAELAA